ncbi:hypothetical protein HQ865_14315 [Mucilaginibacter mali]|uniref:Uncharacterized protein n=1 Tax=Mucilaginibacter mali TaxID=2740462 RepID=A0A7D4QG75_9SPHI|nr:hypothetical protein [Mucilaginibacter mali]QKJ30872.1 hypothetical protein HQ865_14315 [Mucilaginibacter mali]
MKYSEILNGLYNGGIDDVIKILNASIYSTKLNKSDDEIIVVHTGFSFFTHKGTEMEVLVGFSTSSNELVVIRQTRANWSYRYIPLINGVRLRIPQKNHFINLLDNNVFDQIDESGDDYHLRCEEYNSLDEVHNLELIADNFSFKVITNRLILEFPLHRKFKNPVYLNGTIFSRTPQEENDKYDRQSFENYLREDYGENAEDAYWNTE